MNIGGRLIEHGRNGGGLLERRRDTERTKRGVTELYKRPPVLFFEGSGAALD
jgi:hypothetical protein